MSYIGESAGQMFGSLWAAATTGGAAGGAAGAVIGGGVGATAGGVGAIPGAIAGGVGGFAKGTLASFVAMGVGGTFRELLQDKGIQEGLEDGSITPNEILGWATLGGAAVGALDAWPAGKVFKTATGEIAAGAIKEKMRKAILIGAGKTALEEGLTEGLQGAISEFSQAALGGNWDVAERAWSVIDQTMAGAAGGLGPGGAAKAWENYRTPAPPDNANPAGPAGSPSPQPDPPAEELPDPTDGAGPGTGYSTKPRQPRGGMADSGKRDQGKEGPGALVPETPVGGVDSTIAATFAEEPDPTGEFTAAGPAARPAQSTVDPDVAISLAGEEGEAWRQPGAPVSPFRKRKKAAAGPAETPIPTAQPTAGPQVTDEVPIEGAPQVTPLEQAPPAPEPVVSPVEQPAPPLEPEPTAAVAPVEPTVDRNAEFVDRVYQEMQRLGYEPEELSQMTVPEALDVIRASRQTPVQLQQEPPPQLRLPAPAAVPRLTESPELQALGRYASTLQPYSETGAYMPPAPVAPVSAETGAIAAQRGPSKRWQTALEARRAVREANLAKAALKMRGPEKVVTRKKGVFTPQPLPELPVVKPAGAAVTKGKAAIKRAQAERLKREAALREKEAVARQAEREQQPLTEPTSMEDAKKKLNTLLGDRQRYEYFWSKIPQELRHELPERLSPEQRFAPKPAAPQKKPSAPVSRAGLALGPITVHPSPRAPASPITRGRPRGRGEARGTSRTPYTHHLGHLQEHGVAARRRAGDAAAGRRPCRGTARYEPQAAGHGDRRRGWQTGGIVAQGADGPGELLRHLPGQPADSPDRGAGRAAGDTSLSTGSQAGRASRTDAIEGREAGCRP